MKKYLLFLTIAILIVACNDNDIKIINVQATETEEGITVEWSKPDITGFKFYQIMRSSDGKTYSVINSISDKTSDSYKSNVTTFVDYTYPFADSLYYKVIAVGDESVSSENILVKTNKPFIVNNQIYSLSAMPKTDNVAFTYYNNGYKLALGNLSTKKITKEISVNYLSSSDYLTNGKYNNQPEIYYYSYDNYKLYVYDANTLTVKFNSNYCYLSNANIQVGKNGILYMMSRSSGSIYSLNRQSVQQTFNTSTTIYDMKYDSVSNTLIALGSTSVLTYNLGTDGTITAAGSVSIPTYSYYSFIQNTNYLYRKETLNTTIYDYSTGISTSLNNDVSFKSIDYKNGYFYCVPYSSSNVIYCYNASTFALHKKITFRQQVGVVSFDNNYIYFAGYYNSNYSSTYIIDRKELFK